MYIEGNDVRTKIHNGEYSDALLIIVEAINLVQAQMNDLHRQIMEITNPDEIS